MIYIITGTNIEAGKLMADMCITLKQAKVVTCVADLAGCGNHNAFIFYGSYYCISEIRAIEKVVKNTTSYCIGTVLMDKGME